MEVKRLYFDTNVPILLGEGSGETADLLTELFRCQRPAGRLFLCTSELSLSELLVHPYRHEDQRLIGQYEDWLVSGGFMDVAPIQRPVLRNAAVLRARYAALKLPDATHLATALASHCTHFLSADTRLPSHVELQAMGALTDDASSLSVLRPGTDILRNIISGYLAS